MSPWLVALVEQMFLVKFGGFFACFEQWEKFLASPLPVAVGPLLLGRVWHLPECPWPEPTRLSQRGANRQSLCAFGNRWILRDMWGVTPSEWLTCVSPAV